MSFGKNFSPLRGEVFYLKPRSLYIDSEKGKTPAGKRKNKGVDRKADRPAAIVGRKAGQAAEEKKRKEKRSGKAALRIAATAYMNEVSNPQHYNEHPSGVECIEIAEHFGFNIGNAIKYLWRAGLKGERVTDLKKAAWYINREIERLTEPTRIMRIK